MKKLITLIPGFLLLFIACKQNTEVYPDIPAVDYLGYISYAQEDALGNMVLTLRISFDFVDGDGNIGMYPIIDSSELNRADTLVYNLFLQMYDWQEGDFVMIDDEDGGLLKYRIPYLDKEPLVGILDLDIDYPIIVHDTVFYEFYIFDRDFNRSNTDSTDVFLLRNFELDTTGSK